MFVVPRLSVQVDVTADAESYRPGDAVQLTVTTRDTVSNRPVAAIVGVTVADDTVIQVPTRVWVACVLARGRSQAHSERVTVESTVALQRFGMVRVCHQSLPTRQQHPRLPVMALLENEVAHLEDAPSYPVFSTSGAANGTATIDLLLGTQVVFRLLARDYV